MRTTTRKSSLYYCILNSRRVCSHTEQPASEMFEMGLIWKTWTNHLFSVSIDVYH